MDNLILLLRTVFDLAILVFASFMLYDLLSFWGYATIAAAYILVVWESEKVISEDEDLW